MLAYASDTLSSRCLNTAKLREVCVHCPCTGARCTVQPTHGRLKVLGDQVGTPSEVLYFRIVLQELHVPVEVRPAATAIGCVVAAIP